MQVDMKNGRVTVTDPETGEMMIDKPIGSNDDLFDTEFWMQQMTKAIKAGKAAVDNVVAKKVEDNGGPIVKGDRHLVYISSPRYVIPPEAIISQFDDKDFAIDVLVGAMRKDAVSKSGLKKLLDDGVVTMEDTGPIMKQQKMIGSSSYGKVERIKRKED